MDDAANCSGTYMWISAYMGIFQDLDFECTIFLVEESTELSFSVLFLAAIMEFLDSNL